MPRVTEAEAITAEGLDALKAELERLEGEGRREMARRIAAARELGDLKENAEYHIAKEDQAHLETKIKRLRERLRTAVVVEIDGDGDTFAFGRTAGQAGPKEVYFVEQTAGLDRIREIFDKKIGAHLGLGPEEVASAIVRVAKRIVPNSTDSSSLQSGYQTYRKIYPALHSFA